MNANFFSITKNIIDNSLSLKTGDQLFLSCRGESQVPLFLSVTQYCEKKGILVLDMYESESEHEAFWTSATEKDIDNLIRYEGSKMKASDAVLLIREDSKFVMTKEQKEKWKKYYNAVHTLIRLKMKWCLTSLPTRDMAKDYEIDFNKLQNIYFDACSFDYAILEKQLIPLKKLMENTDNVRIVGRDTNLNFSIKNMPAIICSGKNNMPDGEIFTAPIRDSVNGYITYNISSLQNGRKFENVRLEFEKGRIIKTSSSSFSSELSGIFDIDDGARYVGEFAIGVNPKISSPVGSILFDEKIAGSIHFTPGACYDECDNKNHSALHWDLVQIQTKDYGGGEIWFDNKLIRKDGRFTIPSLFPLNQTNKEQSLT